MLVRSFHSGCADTYARIILHEVQHRLQRGDWRKVVVKHEQVLGVTELHYRILRLNDGKVESGFYGYSPLLKPYLQIHKIWVGYHLEQVWEVRMLHYALHRSLRNTHSTYHRHYECDQTSFPRVSLTSNTIFVRRYQA